VILVTGAAGFIGSHVVHALLEQGHTVVGIDNMNDYYDVRLKEARLARLFASERFQFRKVDVTDAEALADIFERHGIRSVIHLAAQAGVRYSLVNPRAYVDSNIVGFLNILECGRNSRSEHLVFASSSSVYGASTHMPFSVRDNVDHPVSLYAATKKANELMAHTYAHLYGLPCTGLRFFTVYGPWGRPDMALFSFTRDILAGTEIALFNYGDMRRDFTYIDDIVEGVLRVWRKPPSPCSAAPDTAPDPSRSVAPYRIYNIGNHDPVSIHRLIELLEHCLGRKASTKLVPMQPGDVPATYADVEDLAVDFDFRPRTPLDVGVRRFVDWYRTYYDC
jgi:UDP-glucuronate 4-epimerase